MFICGVCRDFLLSVDHVEVTKCGHCFHRGCLDPWLKGATTCPQCRAPCLKKDLTRAFFSAGDLPSEEAAVVSRELEEARQRIVELESKVLGVQDLQNVIRSMEDRQKVMEEELRVKDGLIKSAEARQKLHQAKVLAVKNRERSQRTELQTQVALYRARVQVLEKKLEGKETADAVVQTDDPEPDRCPPLPAQEPTTTPRAGNRKARKTRFAPGGPTGTSKKAAKGAVLHDDGRTQRTLDSYLSKK